jgi:hypothetical protein
MHPTGSVLNSVSIASLLLAGCSKQAAPPTVSTSTPVAVLASNERGRPQFDYTGPDSLSYRYSLDTFTFQIGQWGSAKGVMKVGSSNDVTIAIQSTSDRAYDIQLLGFSATNNFNVEEERLKETVHIPPGDQRLTIGRFIIYTYDFAKR